MPFSLQAPHRRRVVEKRERAIDGVSERVLRGRRELDAGRDASSGRRLVGVDHRVGEAADARHDRRRAVAQCAELGEPAGLEAGRHDDEIGARLKEMRKRLVIAEDAADRARAHRGGLSEAVFERPFAGAEQRELAAARDDPRQGWQQEVEPLLLREARDDGEQRPVGAGRQSELALQRSLVARPHVDPERAVVLREGGIGLGIPDLVVDAVEDAVQRGSARAQQAVERHAEFGRHDLAGIGRRDGRDASASLRPAFR